MEQTHAADQTHRAPGKATTASQGPGELIPMAGSHSQDGSPAQNICIIAWTRLSQLGRRTNHSRVRNMEVGIHTAVAALSGWESEELCYP